MNHNPRSLPRNDFPARQPRFSCGLRFPPVVLYFHMGQPVKASRSKPGRHRGADPEDERSFGARRLADLRQAVSDVCWLLDRGYGISSATELAGDRYHLTRRQRIAVARCSCSGQARERRRSHSVAPSDLCGRELWLDGLNVLTAVETALGGGVILIGRDGCCRDVAGVYSHYRKVEETVPALEMIGKSLAQWGVSGCRWWLDSPVFNSGRLKAIILEAAMAAGWPWGVELVTNPDRVLSTADQIIASADHVILDRCRRWFNLTRQVIASQVPQARVADLGDLPIDEVNQGASAGLDRTMTKAGSDPGGQTAPAP